MIVIRFLRIGKKNQPFFRLVATEKKNAPRAGRFLEILGFFNPQTKEKQVNKERVLHWISKGAQPSPRAHNLFVKEGIIKGEKIATHSKSKKKPAEAAATQKPASTEAKDEPAQAKEPEAPKSEPSAQVDK